MTAMTVSLAFIGLFLLLIFIILAVRIGISKEKVEVEEQHPMIHASGIYSVVRRSPREEVLKGKASEDEIRKYLASKNEDYSGKRLGEQDKEDLVSTYLSSVDQQIRLVEEGDRSGAEFYFYDYEWLDPVCAKHIMKGQFVTREDLFKFPNIVPPFHLGCGCRLKRHQGGEKLRDTTEFGLRPFVRDDAAAPELPDWKCILKLPRG